MRTATDLVSMRLAVCYILYDRERANGMEITSEVEELVGEDVAERRVYETLYDLRADGVVSQGKENQTRGKFWLTDDGRELLEDHHDWFEVRFDDDLGQQTF